ncbi:ABC transporter permease [Defluviitalea phaphyphila]|uniref:ABC transporter permease n=1 Tax=Defluviitalea phaphyphila TaxID=1473580 RepID=UPI0007306A10|nr:FtsX-like permease family protein [Defluviitalea phaphyphila]
MISLKLIKANSDNCKSILFAIVLCVTVFITSLIYIEYSLQDMDKEIAEKYGNIDIVFYDTNGSSDIYRNLINQEEVVNVAWQSNIPAYIDNYSIILHILDFEAHNAVNSIKNIDKKLISNMKGIFLSRNSLKVLGTEDNIFDLTVNGIKKEVKIAGVLDEKSFYEVANTSQINVYISKDYYNSIFEEEIIKNVYLVDLGDVSSTKASQFAHKFDNLISHNIVDKINLQKKESSQSFIYAVSFILIGLIGIVFGSLYNFSKTIISENIEHIGFLRTIGLSHQKATVLYKNMILLLGMIGEVIGIILGIILGNLLIYVKYGFSGFMFSKFSILLSLIISVVAPYIFMAIEMGKYKKHKPIQLLLLYRNHGYDEKEDMINKYIINSLFYIVFFIVLMSVRDKINDTANMILSAFAVFAVVKSVENSVVVLFHMLSLLSNKFINTRPLLALSFKNLARNKKKTASVFGTFILILAFYIGMYNVFYTIRTDAANKVELQYNGDAFITKYNQTQEVIEKKIDSISKLPIVESIETSHSRFLTLGGNRIEGYILSESEFEKFFNLLDVQTGKKALLPDSKQGGIIGESLAKKGNIKVGDRLTLSDDSNTYEIIVEGICNAYEYMGNVVYLNEKYFSYPVNNITLIFKEGVDIDQGIKIIKDSFSEDDVFTPTIKSKEQIKESYRINAIKGTMFIEVILVFISIIGVFMLINQAIQFINGRKREFTLMRVMGSSLNEIMKINFMEFIIFAIIGIIGGIISGILVTWEFVDIASISSGIGKVLSYHYDISNILIFSIFIFILYSLSLIIILYKLKNKTIITAVKEE